MPTCPVDSNRSPGAPRDPGRRRAPARREAPVALQGEHRSEAHGRAARGAEAVRTRAGEEGSGRWTSQREIESAVRRALEVGRLEGDEKLKVSARIQIEPIGLDHRVEGEIALS
ncbi:MAG: DUF6494 family protein [Myxococcota bacterium]